MKITSKERAQLIGVLLSHFDTASKTTVKKSIAHGNIKVNGTLETNPAVFINPGDEVEYTRQTYRPGKMKPPFPVVFEDDHILVAEKPAGLLTIGDRGLGGTSFYRQLAGYVKENSKGKEQIFVVHRLDREVSGLLLFAKSEIFQAKIKDHWAEVKKRYYALVEGQPEMAKERFETGLPKVVIRRYVQLKDLKGQNWPLPITM